jgi:hypothetical protein
MDYKLIPSLSKDVSLLNTPSQADRMADIAELNFAESFHDRLIEMIGEFEKELDDQHEAGIRLVSFGQTVIFHLEDIGYYNPSLIRFFGRTEDGNPVELIQNVSQISILLMKLQKADSDKPARRVGFATDSHESKD